jgi:hypothetical protein
MKNKVLHASVGFGIFSYCKNSINGFIKNISENESFFLVITGTPYNFGFKKKYFFDNELDDLKKIKQYVNLINKKKKRIHLKIINKKNNQKLKTGNLYQGYNFLIRFCLKKKIRFLNIVQNDMQMVWWDKKNVKLCEEIFNNNSNCFALMNTFSRAKYDSNVVLEKQPRIQFYSKTFKRKFSLFEERAAYSDCAIFDINKIKKINFKFQNTAHNNSYKYYDHGYRQLNFPIPFAAAIPWPAVVRKNKIYGRVDQFQNGLAIKLKNKEDKFTLLKKKQIFFYHEDWIKGTFGYTLEPICYTDWNIISYLSNFFKNKYIYKRNIRFKYTMLNKKNKNFFHFFSFRSYPNLWLLLIDKTYYLILRIAKKFL